MKNRIISFLLAIVLSFGVFSATVPVVASASVLEAVEIVATVAEVLELLNNVTSAITSPYTQKIEAARYAYFYYMASNSDHKSITMLNGEKFTDEYLYSYFRDYILYPEAHIHSLDVFMTSAGFADTEWVYDMIAFTSFKAFGFGYIEDFCKTHSTYDDGILDLSTAGYKNFEKFRDYYNCVLAQYFVRYKMDSMTIGQDTLNNANRDIFTVASPIVSADALKDELIAQNYLYTPKSGGTFKFGYRSEKYLAQVHSAYGPVLRFYNADYGFCEQGYNDLWFVPYLITDDGEMLLAQFQYRIYFDNWEPVQTEGVNDLNRYCVRVETYSYVEGLDGALLDDTSVICKSPEMSGLPHYFLLLPYYSTACPFSFYFPSSLSDYLSGYLGNGSPTPVYNRDQYYYSSDLSSCVKTDYLAEPWTTTYKKNFQKSYADNPKKTIDVGFLCSGSQIQFKYDFDIDRLPSNSTITISGDSVYDYSITDNSTGDTTTINEYVTNNYNYPAVDNSGSGTNGGSGGKIEVGGKVEVGGNVDVNVNVNVNGNGCGGVTANPGDYIGDTSGVDMDIAEYIELIPKTSNTFIDFMKDFFSWLPPPIFGLIILGFLFLVVRIILKR